MQARFYAPWYGRFLSPDPGRDQHFEDTQSWNIYSYVRNQPTMQIDPDGMDAIPVAFPDFKISAAGTKWSNLGHAGIVTVDKTGHTRYSEYGRYDKAAKGLTRGGSVPNLVMGKDGLPTKASLKNLMQVLSKKFGQGGKVEGAYVKNDETKKMNDYTDSRIKQNDDPNRKEYSLFSNSCATYQRDVLEAGGVDTPSKVDPRPNSYIGELQSSNSSTIEYTPGKGGKPDEMKVEDKRFDEKKKEK